MKLFYLLSLVLNLFLSGAIHEVLGYAIRVYNHHHDAEGSFMCLLYAADLSFVTFFQELCFTCLPLAILVWKDYRYHWLLFSIFNAFSAALYFWFWYHRVSMDRLYGEAAYFILSGTLLSVVAHVTQLSLGKRLLPERYGRRPG
ncbi:MAG: hypothetical protein RLZZ165_769 [Bacteroidota bacterium]|jgi:hypothetical protein